MRWIGQHIWDFISRFRNDVYLEDIETGTIASGANLGLDSNNKVVKNTVGGGGTTDLTSDVTGVLPIANGGTNSNSAANARTALGVDAAGTDNSTNVTLAGTPDYITISGQEITRNAIDLTADVTGATPIANGGTGSTSASDARTALGVDAAGTDNSTNVTLTGTPDYITISGQEITRNQIDVTSDVTGFLPVANGGTGANNVTGARASLGVDAAGTDNSTNVTLAGEDYLSLSGQEITASDIDLTDNVTGILPIANGGTGSSSQKVIQIFPMNFVDNLGTDKHFMPFVTNVEQTVNYQEEAAMVMPADGRVVSVTVHMAQMHNNDGDITIGIETSPCGQSYTNAWTVEETETLPATQTDDHHVFHFAFSDAKHFESTNKMAISIQQSAAMQSANRFFWVSAVIEYDWSTFLGGTSAEYTTTP